MALGKRESVRTVLRNWLRFEQRDFSSAQGFGRVFGEAVDLSARLRSVVIAQVCVSYLAGFADADLETDSKRYSTNFSRCSSKKAGYPTRGFGVMIVAN